MLDVSSSMLVDGGAFVVRVREHQNVLRDDLAGAFGDFPHFVIFADEGTVFGHGAAFGDEPGHVEDFELAVVVVPVQVKWTAVSCPRAVLRRGTGMGRGEERWG